MFCVVLFVQRAPVTKANQFRRDKWKLHDAGKLVAREHLDKDCVAPGPMVERYRLGEIVASVLCQPFLLSAQTRFRKIGHSTLITLLPAVEACFLLLYLLL